VHKEEEWMKEKYDPEMIKVQREDNLTAAKVAAEAFNKSLAAGQITACYDYPYDAEDEAREAKKQEEKEQKEKKATEAKAAEAMEGGEDGEVKEVAKEESKVSDTASTVVEEVAPSRSLHIRGVPCKMTRAELEKICKPEGGSVELKFSEPISHKNFNRLVWCHYETPEICAAMLEKINGASVGEDKDEMKLDAVTHNTKSTGKALGKPKLTARSFQDKVRIKIDVSQVRRLVKHLDKEKGIETNPAVLGEEEKEEKEEKKDKEDKEKKEDEEKEKKQENEKKKESRTVRLDRMIAYLRQVHLMEYYAGEEFLEASELERKHPGGYCRNKGTQERERYRETKQEGQLDSKLRARLDRKWVLDLRLGTDFVEAQMEKFYSSKTQKVSDEKYGCTLSNKFFREPKFVKKHIQTKHQAIYEEELAKHEKQVYFENYFADPHRVRPPPPPGMFPPARPLSGKGGSGKGGDWGSRGSPYLRGRSPPRRRSPPRDRGYGRSRDGYGTPASGGRGDPRAIRSYNDLDGATDDLQPIDFDDVESLVEVDPLGL